MTRVRFVTLGCKVNQYETQGMREALLAGGASEGEGPDTSCDFVVINTCTVTEKADRESRYWIRRARREHPNARIVVTGCYVERNRREIEALPEVDLILSNHEKAGIADRLLQGCAHPALQDGGAGLKPAPTAYGSLSISRSEGHARAFLKVQDGCNHACSFCKVVLVRGRSRSRSLSDIVEEAVRLRDSGYREIVFTGIQLGAYGLDLGASVRLPEVIEACSAIEGIERLRLSSIEPTDVNRDLIEAMCGHPKCCPHLHIPLQSGDDEILTRMNRRYRRSFYIDLVAELKSRWPDFSLTLDVMAGFPGEDEPNFQNTLRLLEAVKPLKCHVFPYSRRPGTRAARFEDCDAKTVRERVNVLIALAERLGQTERAKYQGRVMPVLVEKNSARGRLVQGLTANYLKVCFQGGEDQVGQIVSVELLALQGDVFLGRQLSDSSPQDFSADGRPPEDACPPDGRRGSVRSLAEIRQLCGGSGDPRLRGDDNHPRG